MKKLILAAFISFPVLAVELNFIGPCSEEFIMRTQVTEEFNHVGDLTIATLNKYKIPFHGYPEGMASVFGFGNYMETLADNEFRAYGWCFKVDGVMPEVFPYEAYLTPETKTISWIYGYSHFKNGEWLSQCEEAFKVKPKELCENLSTGIKL